MKDEYLFVVSGMLHSIDSWAMSLRSSDASVGSLSCVLNDNGYPPYANHKFNRDDIIKIRNYLNEYLERTEI